MKQQHLSISSYYLLSFTWGSIMSIIGVMIAAALLCCGYPCYRNIYGWYFMIGRGWGGISLGPIALVARDCNSEHTLNHEFGHSIQNCYFGPFMICIGLASAIRYWYREFLKKYKIPLKPYDSIWFEGQATKIGKEYYMRR